ncbi:hypothetical protein BDZ45DRAFT_732937 [Acephala macrosclerotiorum]|nr:hypothetical protein BDZ45DRAFT_732937 [Acephala macrosclerotiorum]
MTGVELPRVSFPMFSTFTLDDSCISFLPAASIAMNIPSPTTNSTPFIETPPESFIHAPLTPPPTDPKPSTRALQVLSVLRNLKDGRSNPILDQPWHAIRLQPGGYKEVQKLVEADGALSIYVNNKVRYDYWPHSRKLILRMPTRLHESFIGSVARDIDHQLRLIASGNGPSAEFARDVEDDRSSRLSFKISDNEISRHEPDSSFYHIKAKWPGVIFEISYTQKRPDLAKLAHVYIVESNGTSRAVVGLDIEYKGKRKQTKRATISIFRDDDGNEVPGSDLKLQLRDFATTRLLQQFGPLTEDITIPASKLCEYLERSEVKHGQNERHSGDEEALPPGALKKSQDEATVDELGTDDELRFKEQEERAAKRIELDESSYEASSADDEVRDLWTW